MRFPTGKSDSFRKALYCLFARPFSRYADSRLWKFIRQGTEGSIVGKKDYAFPSIAR